MRKRNIVILFVIGLFINESVFGQVTPAKADSTKIYKDIESYSGKNKFTRFMYQFFFKPVTVSSHEKESQKKRIQEVNPNYPTVLLKEKLSGK